MRDQRDFWMIRYQSIGQRCHGMFSHTKSQISPYTIKIKSIQKQNLKTKYKP